MRTQVLIIFLLILVAPTVMGQSEPKKIHIDFNSRTLDLSNVQGITEGNFYQIEIDNINLNLFKVALFSKDTMISSPQKTPTFGSLNLDDISKIVANISFGSTMSSQAYKEFVESSEKFKHLSQSTRPTDPDAFIKNEMVSHKNFIDNNKSKLDELILRIDDIKKRVFLAQLAAMKLDKPSDVLTVEDMVDEIEEVRPLLIEIKREVIYNKLSYELFSSDNRTRIGAQADLTSNDKSLKEAYDKLITVLNEAITSRSAAKMRELLTPLVFIENNCHYKYLSLPLQFTGEQTRLKVTITPRDEKYTENVYATQIKFPLHIKNYTVLGLSFYGSNLYDQGYSISKLTLSDSTAEYSIKKEKVTKAEIGVAAMLRYGEKFEKTQLVGYHFSFGAGMSIADKVKPRLLLGGGLTRGKKHMFAVDAGLIAGFVDRLSSNLSTKETYDEKPENIMRSRLKVGGFLAIGYTYQF
jgi:hypothetical protein